MLIGQIMVVADVRTSNAFACRTFEEVWVILAPYETTGVLVNLKSATKLFSVLLASNVLSSLN